MSHVRAIGVLGHSLFVIRFRRREENNHRDRGNDVTGSRDTCIQAGQYLENQIQRLLLANVQTHTFIALPSRPVINRSMRKISIVHPAAGLSDGHGSLLTETYRWLSLGLADADWLDDKHGVEFSDLPKAAKAKVAYIAD